MSNNNNSKIDPLRPLPQKKKPLAGEIIVHCHCGNDLVFIPSPAMIVNQPHFSQIIITHEDVVTCRVCNTIWSIGITDSTEIKFKGIKLEPQNLAKRVLLASGSETPN